jgi:hypothetical protein
MRTTISRGAIYKVPGKYADTASLHVTFNRETLTINGHVFSGYTLSESLCRVLLDAGIAKEWEEAIAIVEEMGVPYVTDEDDTCDACEEVKPLTHNPVTDMYHCDECADK